MAGDKLVVGHQEFVRTVAGGLAQADDHSCEQQTRPDYKAMAKVLWASGYRFDKEARVQWLAVELRGRLAGNEEIVGMVNELLTLLEVDV